MLKTCDKHRTPVMCSITFDAAEGECPLCNREKAIKEQERVEVTHPSCAETIKEIICILLSHNGPIHCNIIRPRVDNLGSAFDPGEVGPITNMTITLLHKPIPVKESFNV